jgi:hypothetical protein
VGARRFHVAVLDTALTVHLTSDIDDAVRLCVGAERIAIDASSEPATGRVHDGARSPKFAVARCNEIAAGEQLGIWVPWVTPTIDAAPEWMRRGFALWAALRADGHEPIETYPAGSFWLRNGRRWPPKKSTPEGRAVRRALLGLDADLPTHDHIDAAMCALVARGPAQDVGHDHPSCDTSRLFVLT